MPYSDEHLDSQKSNPSSRASSGRSSPLSIVPIARRFSGIHSSPSTPIHHNKPVSTSAVIAAPLTLASQKSSIVDVFREKHIVSPHSPRASSPLSNLNSLQPRRSRVSSLIAGSGSGDWSSLTRNRVSSISGSLNSYNSSFQGGLRFSQSFIHGKSHRRVPSVPTAFPMGFSGSQPRTHHRRDSSGSSFVNTSVGSFAGPSPTASTYLPSPSAISAGLLSAGIASNRFIPEPSVNSQTDYPLDDLNIDLPRRQRGRAPTMPNSSRMRSTSIASDIFLPPSFISSSSFSPSATISFPQTVANQRRRSSGLGALAVGQQVFETEGIVFFTVPR